jgi:hypothetical protein
MRIKKLQLAGSIAEDAFSMNPTFAATAQIIKLLNGKVSKNPAKQLLNRMPQHQEVYYHEILT